MAAPKGNEFWKLRSKHGRDKIFKTPEIMLVAINEYFKWCEENPLIEIDFKGKDAKEVELPRMRAFTIHGLCLFLDVNTAYFNHFEAELNVKNNEIDKSLIPLEIFPSFPSFSAGATHLIKNVFFY